jgi:hypothetical protein
MANSRVRGFIPVRNLDGSNNFPTTLRPTLGKNDSAIFAGDMVFLDASGGIQRYHEAVSGGDSRPPLGVVAQVFNADRRPFTFNQPGTGPLIPTSTRGFAAVNENPHTVYTINTSATANFQLHVGKLQAIRVCAASTALGRSGMSLTLGTTVTGDGHPLKLVNIAGPDEEVRVCGEANNDVEVVVVNGQWVNPWFSHLMGIPISGNVAGVN